MMSKPPILQVKDLEVAYEVDRGDVRAVDRVSFDIFAGELFGLAGESGSGKSTIAFAIARLLNYPAVINGGEVWLDGRELLGLSEEAFRRLRWRELSIVFQSAMHALNPVLTVGEQMIDAILAHEDISRTRALQRAAELFELVHIERSRLDAYPHQLSGGMRQRAIIAMALLFEPKLVIMDEPTTALDVVVQKQILHELEGLRRTLDFALLFITHDLSLLAEMADRIGIMYGGKLVEYGSTADLFAGPAHPYTEGLIASFPSIHGEPRRLMGIPGSPPDLIDPPSGCPFHPRCPKAIQRCRLVEPAWIDLNSGHGLSCHLFEEAPGSARAEAAGGDR